MTFNIDLFGVNNFYYLNKCNSTHLEPLIPGTPSLPTKDGRYNMMNNSVVSFGHTHILPMQDLWKWKTTTFILHEKIKFC